MHRSPSKRLTRPLPRGLFVETKNGKDPRRTSCAWETPAVRSHRPLPPRHIICIPASIFDHVACQRRGIRKSRSIRLNQVVRMTAGLAIPTIRAVALDQPATVKIESQKLRKIEPKPLWAIAGAARLRRARFWVSLALPDGTTASVERVRFWHLADMTRYADQVRFKPGSGHPCVGPSKARL